MPDDAGRGARGAAAPALGPGAEFDAIRRMLARWGPLARGIGDDAAVLSVPDGERLVVSVDTAIEEVHFRRAWLSAREIGYRAAVAALSDLAAMGAHPLGLLLALALPEAWREELDALADGVGDAARLTETPIVGGNISAGRELSLTTTVLGSAPAPIGRAGARPGDRLFVTGRLGGPGAAIRALRKGASPAPAERERFAAPVPRLREGRWFARHGVHAMIDVSDGLVADAGHLASAGGVRIGIALERVPLLAGLSPRDAAASGEEYELLVAAAASLDGGAFRRELGLELTEIGRVAAGTPGVEVTLDGARVASAAGHDHLSV